ncbi:unnamed protein product, partial [Iphiclides podalirius]
MFANKVWNGVALQFVSMVMAQILTVSHVLGVGNILLPYALDEKVLKMLLPNNRNIWIGLVIYSGAISFIIFLASAMAVCSVLLITSLFKRNHQLVKAYLLFSTFMLVTSIYFYFLYESMLITDSIINLQRVLSILINVLYLIVMKSYDSENVCTTCSIKNREY